MSDIDQQFIEYVVKSLVGKPDAVHIDRRVDDKGVLLELTVDPEDLGRVIGKRGATAQSLRTLLRALGTKNQARYNLKIIDNGFGRDEHNISPDESERPVANDSTSNDVAVADVKEVVTEDHEPVTGTSIVEEVAAEIVAEQPEAVTEVEKPEPKVVADETSDRLAQTRKELAEFDDLDL